ncbi:14801_t:CDS:2, partial [Cetraspora pellucida]
QINLVVINKRTVVQIGNQALNKAFNQPDNIIVKLRAVEVKEKLWDLQYRTIRKRNMTIDELYRKLLQIGRQANYRPKELCNKFLNTLSILWLKKAKNISEYLLLDKLAKKLYEIEL